MVRALNKFISLLFRTYYLGPDHPMKMRIYYGLRRRMGYPRLTISYLKQAWITLDERDMLQREILYHGHYEHEVWGTLRRFADSDEVVWDIGAHIGCFSIQAGLDPHIREVHAFEPDPLLAEILEVNLNLNSGKYILHHFALSNQKEKRSFFHGPVANLGLSSLKGFSSRQQVFQVPCQTADELIWEEGMNPPTLMKVDVEGWEFQVLRGAEKLFEKSPPKAIIFETDYEGDSLGLVTEYLGRFGYRISHILRPNGQKEEKENYLAVLREPQFS